MPPSLRSVVEDDELDKLDNERTEDAVFEEEEKRQRRGQNPFEKSLTDKLLTKTFYGVFKLAALLTRSTAEFEEDEFKEPAQDTKDLINRFKPLRVFFNILHPVVSCVSLIKKVEKLREGMPRKQPKPAAPDLGPMYGASNN